MIVTGHENLVELHEMIEEVLADKDATIKLLREAITETTRKLNERTDRMEKAIRG